MKKLIITLFFLHCGICFSQLDLGVGKLKYRETFKDGGVFNYYLYFNENNSSYVLANPNDTIVKFVSTSKLIFDFDRKSNILTQYREIVDEKYVVQDTLKYLNWFINYEDIKTINNYNCNKATVNFRGINYIAWYTNEIPVNYGPWKFRGLPGLILQVYDEGLNFEVFVDEININKVKRKEVEENLKTLNDQINISWEKFVVKLKNEDIEIERRLSALLGRDTSISYSSSGFRKEKL